MYGEKFGKDNVKLIQDSKKVCMATVVNVTSTDGNMSNFVLEMVRCIRKNRKEFVVLITSWTKFII